MTVADRGDGASPILAYTVPEARRVLCPTAAAESTPGRGGTYRYREVLRDEKRKEDEQWRQQPQWQQQRQQWQRQRWQQQQQHHEKQQQQQLQQLLRPRLQVALTSKAAPPTCIPLPAGMALRDAPAAIGCLPPCVTITKRASGASGALQLRAMMAASAASSTAAALSTAAIATAAAVAAAATAAVSTNGTTPTAACVTPSVAHSAATVAAVAAVTTLRATVIGPAPSAVIGTAPSAAGGAAPAISIESTSSLKATASTSDASLILGRVSAAGGDLKALSELSQFSQSRLLEQLKGLGISKLGERVAAANMLRSVNMLRSGAPLTLPASSARAARLSVASATPATESVGASAGLVNRDEGSCDEGGRDEGGCKEGGRDEGGREGGASGTRDTMIVDPPTVACPETMPMLEDGDSESLPDVPNLGTDLGTDLGRIWSQPSLGAQLSSVSLPDFLTLWPSPAAPGRPSAPVPPTSTAPVSMPGRARPLERKRTRELLIGEMDEGNEGTSADDALEGGSDECCRAGAAEPGSEGLPSISGRISGLDGLLPMSKWLQPVTEVKVPGSPLLLRPGSSKRRGLL